MVRKRGEDTSATEGRACNIHFVVVSKFNYANSSHLHNYKIQIKKVIHMFCSKYYCVYV